MEGGGPRLAFAGPSSQEAYRDPHAGVVRGTGREPFTEVVIPTTRAGEADPVSGCVDVFPAMFRCSVRASRVASTRPRGSTPAAASPGMRRSIIVMTIRSRWGSPGPAQLARHRTRLVQGWTDPFRGAGSSAFVEIAREPAERSARLACDEVSGRHRGGLAAAEVMSA